ILGELIRYLEHPKSGALAFDDMGPAWVPVRESVAAGTLRASDKNASEVANQFDALIRFACLQLGRKHETEVERVGGRRVDPATRVGQLVTTLVKQGQLRAIIRSPQAISPMEVVACLRANRITCHFDIAAPQEGRATTRVNWLVRQLKD